MLALLKKHFVVPYPILVAAHTHVAVDLITAKCGLAGLKPLRFGYLERIKPELHDHSYTVKLGQHRFQYRLQARYEQEKRIQDRLKDLEFMIDRPAYGTNIFDSSDEQKLHEAERQQYMREKGMRTDTAFPE